MTRDVYLAEIRKLSFYELCSDYVESRGDHPIKLNDVLPEQEFELIEQLEKVLKEIIY